MHLHMQVCKCITILSLNMTNINNASKNKNNYSIVILLVEAILVRVFFPVVAWTDLENKVSHVLRCHLNGNINPLSGFVRRHDDSRVAPWTSSFVWSGINFPGVSTNSTPPIVYFPLMLLVRMQFS